MIGNSLPIEGSALPSGGLTALLLVELQWAESIGKLFITVSTFSTPQDLTTDELRVEMFYPADESTRLFFESLSIE